jgi:molecular chaperone DnaK
LAEKNPIVGIDLGATSAGVSYLGKGSCPATLLNFEGEVRTPAALTIADHAALVGREALKAAAHGEPVAERFLPCLGRGALEGRPWRPEVLTGLLLRRLRDDVTRTFGVPGRPALAVPAWFDAGARRALLEAAALAGWPDVPLVNDPVAAALALADHEQRGGEARDECVLVCHLGGETCEAAAIRYSPGQEYRMLGGAFDAALGGRLWDERLAGLVAQRFRAAAGFEPRETPEGAAAIAQLARQAKQTLSDRQTTTLPCNVRGTRAAVDLTRAEFEERTADLLERVRGVAERALGTAGLGWSGVDRVMPIGGASRMPMVARLLREASGKALADCVPPDEAVANGAALFARARHQRPAPRIVNVSPNSYRMAHLRQAVPLIAANSLLPGRKTQMFKPKPNAANEMRLSICVGESDEAAQCRPLAWLRVTGLPQGGAAYHLAVVFTCRDDGALEAFATIRKGDDPRVTIGTAPVEWNWEQAMSSAQLGAARRIVESFEIN